MVTDSTIRRQLWNVSFVLFDPNYSSAYFLWFYSEFTSSGGFKSHYFNIAEAKHSTSTSVTPTSAPISPPTQTTSSASSPHISTISGSQGAGIAIGSLAGFILIFGGIGYILRKKGIPLIPRNIATQGRQELDAADTEKHQQPTELGGNPLSEAQGAIEIYELER